jgi:plasmid stabilization system protein ParE
MEYSYSYRFTEKAAKDLDDILRYISVDLSNPIAAQNFGKRVFEKIDLVRSFPLSCERVSNEFLDDNSIFKMLVDNYIIYYKVHFDEKIISILRVVYGKRNLDEILKTI